MSLIYKWYFRGREGETALHMASSCGCHELVLLLLKQGAQVDPEVQFCLPCCSCIFALFIIGSPSLEVSRAFAFGFVCHPHLLKPTAALFIDNSFYMPNESRFFMNHLIAALSNTLLPVRRAVHWSYFLHFQYNFYVPETHIMYFIRRC